MCNCLLQLYCNYKILYFLMVWSDHSYALSAVNSLQFALNGLMCAFMFSVRLKSCHHLCILVTLHCYVKVYTGQDTMFVYCSLINKSEHKFLCFKYVSSVCTYEYECVHKHMNMYFCVSYCHLYRKCQHSKFTQIPIFPKTKSFRAKPLASYIV